MKDIITKLFNLEQRMIHDIEMIHVGNEVFAIISLKLLFSHTQIYKKSSYAYSYGYVANVS